VKQMSLEQLTQLVESVTRQATNTKDKRGAVFIKCRRGKGHTSPVLVVMLAGTWKEVDDDPA
jgi:hypothetical protein